MAKRRSKTNRSTDPMLNPSSAVAASAGGIELPQPPMDDMSFGGIPSPGIHRGKMDPDKTRIADRMQKVASGVSRNAGMMMDNTWFGHPTYGNMSLDSYHTSYASGNTMYGGSVRDIPTYFIMMNQQNGGVLYWPVSLREKFSWYRYWARSDAYVGRALELLSDLPMSKITLNLPQMNDKGMRDEIHDFFSYMCERMNLFERLHQVLWDLNMIGNCHMFMEWDEKRKMWARAVMLPPEEVSLFTYPFSDNARVEYRPEKLLSVLKMAAEQGENITDPFYKEIVDRVPKDLKDMVAKQGCIIMDSDPFAGGQVGSFCYNFARRKSPYEDLGASVLERVLVPMLMKENFRYTQLALATRNMTPKNKISAPGLNNDELAELRMQIDLSYMDPDYSVVTNYDWTWEQVGAEGRILDLSSEYEMIENHVFAGLGVTRELLTGEGTYSGNRITVEILNTVFLLQREMLTRYVEQYLFKPVAHANGWFTTGKNGIKKYIYPKLGFNRLTIRDNQEVFESLFQLYQKGSLPVDIIYELFNLDVESIHDRIKGDLFTVKDPTFNRTVEEVNTEIGRQMVEKTDVLDRVVKYLGIKMKAPEGEEGGAEGGGATMNNVMDEVFGGGEGEASEPPTETPDGGNQEDSIAQAVADSVPPDATREDVEAVVQQVNEKGV